MTKSYDQEYQINKVPLQTKVSVSIDKKDWTRSISRLHKANVNTNPSLGSVPSAYYFNQQYEHNGNLQAAENPAGIVYCPVNDRMYLVPNYASGFAQAGYFIDCHTSKVESYVIGAGDGEVDYVGGVYVPNTNKIAFIPGGSTVSDDTNIKYLDVSDNTLHAVSGTFSLAFYPYAGGVYSPTQNRIYCVPHGQADESNWHYITGSTWTAYAHGLTTFACQDNAYYGGVYSPTQNRIYFVPYGQSDEIFWHFIDCDDGTVSAYYHGATVVANGYRGGAYSPTQNRIYFAPYGQSDVGSELWHYIDCDDGTVGTYAAPEVYHPSNEFIGAVYSPISNRIFFIPSANNFGESQTFIDCDTGVAYYFNTPSLGVGAYLGGCFDPIKGRIYYAPRGRYGETYWHYIQETGLMTDIARHMFGTTFLSSTL